MAFLNVLGCILVLSNFAFLVKSNFCGQPKKVLDYEWNSTLDGLYFPIGERNDTSLVKQMLYGSSLNADEDLPKLCYKGTFKESSFIISGVNGTSATFTCKKLDAKKWTMECKYDDSNDKPEYNHKFYVPLSDKKSFALVIRCWGNGLKGWTVFSTRKFLHDDVQLQILEHVKTLGFQTADTLPLGYKQCSKP